MKRSILAGAVLSLVVGTMASASAMAAVTDPGGTITINGQVRVETCTVNVNGSGSGDATVTMPDAFESDFTGVNQGTPLSTKQGDVSIALTACQASATSVAAHFDRNSANIESGTNFLKNTANGPTNVGYALLDGQDSDQIIDLGSQTYNEKTKNVAAQAATLDYKVAYVQDAAGTLSVGPVNSSIVYELYYP